MRPAEVFQRDPIACGSYLARRVGRGGSPGRPTGRCSSTRSIGSRSEPASSASGVGTGIEARCACAPKRGRGRREPISPIDRAPLRYTPKARARPDSPSLRRVAATRTPPPRRPKQLRTALEASPPSGSDAFAGRAERRAPGDRRARPQTDRGHTRPTHAPGGPDLPPCRERGHQSRDRRSAVHQPKHRRVPPAQGVPQART